MKELANKETSQEQASVLFVAGVVVFISAKKEEALSKHSFSHTFL